MGPLAWALTTGIMTGAVWALIVLFRRPVSGSPPDPRLNEDVLKRLDNLDDISRRLAEVEERLDTTERLLARQRDENRLPPPG
jgi:hypothetical protein